MHRSIWTLSLAFATLLSAGAAYAAGPLAVDLNGTRRVMLHGTVANVFVADPSVADVNMIDTHSVIVIGKGYGVTSILVTDHAGHTLYDGAIAVLGSEAGRVTVYRGGAAQDYHCSTRCETMNAAAAAAPVNAGGSTASGGGSGGGDNTPMNIGPPVTVTQAGGIHP